MNPAYRKFCSTDILTYQSALELRNDLLRKPIGKNIYDEDLTIEKDNDFYGVFLGDQLIGTLSYFEESAGIAHLTAFAVAEKFQGQGLGRGLVKFLIKDLRRKSFKQINVDARATAKTFYQKCGFLVESGPILNKYLAVEDYKMVYLLNA